MRQSVIPSCQKMKNICLQQIAILNDKSQKPFWTLTDIKTSENGLISKEQGYRRNISSVDVFLMNIYLNKNSNYIFYNHILIPVRFC